MNITADLNTKPIGHRIEKVFGQFLLTIRDQHGSYQAGRFDTRADAENYYQQHYANRDR